MLFTWKPDAKPTFVNYDWYRKWQFFSQYYNANWYYNAGLCQRRYLLLLLLYIFYQADENVLQGLLCVRVDQEESYVGK